MGCFSFMCKNSDRAVAYGDAVRLYLLKDGKVIEEMAGFYDSYGRVYSDKKRTEPFKWNMDWENVVDLIYNNDSGDGIAAVLECYANGIIPTDQSYDDENQGSGRRNGQGVIILEPYHKVY